MELMSTLTSKGQTTVPKDIRDLLGVEPRQKLMYVVEGDKVILKAASKSLLSVAGSLSGSKPAATKAEERKAYRENRTQHYQKNL
jgi:AbrB family looped-hinge helix DNA binding protein